MASNIENNNETKKVSEEFVTAVKKYLEIDDLLKDIKEKVKKLSTDKKSNEDFILNYLHTIDEKVIDVYDGKLRRNISKTQSSLKKDTIQKTLTDILNDNLQALTITEQIFKSRPTIERITLKRTRTKNKATN